MLVLVDLFVFKVVVAPELGVASSRRVGGFQQIVTKVTIAGLDHSGMLCLEITGLVLSPHQTGILGNRGLGVKTVDAADLSNNTGRVYLADAGNGCKGIGDDLKLLLNGLIQKIE